MYFLLCCLGSVLISLLFHSGGMGLSCAVQKQFQCPECFGTLFFGFVKQENDTNHFRGLFVALKGCHERFCAAENLWEVGHSDHVRRIPQFGTKRDSRKKCSRSCSSDSFGILIFCCNVDEQFICSRSTFVPRVHLAHHTCINPHVCGTFCFETVTSHTSQKATIHWFSKAKDRNRAGCPVTTKQKTIPPMRMEDITVGLIPN